MQRTPKPVHGASLGGGTRADESAGVPVERSLQHEIEPDYERGNRECDCSELDEQKAAADPELSHPTR
jgi:hypothetical protein